MAFLLMFGIQFSFVSVGQKSSTIAIDLRIIGVKPSPKIEAAITQMLNNAVQQLMLNIPAGYYKTL
ncbi:hypothetical protein E7T06_07850 [Deinococcus sp. Arct2-2]|uniref:hypothetical protein n=1 Tax=Deinococcus sp. Arct2-2 TaxID=2568653 RepID=UPI0010A52042|nr:hypothetical protein [Deinococcus sp. Arct2-2]THF70371.1 hypothetical protein E7T06_07850 [Deinococcus sp. Arct2-2]